MAIICCASPSELCLEETRSTLQFALTAKLGKTNARVNHSVPNWQAEKEVVLKETVTKLKNQLKELQEQADSKGEANEPISMELDDEQETTEDQETTEEQEKENYQKLQAIGRQQQQWPKNARDHKTAAPVHRRFPGLGEAAAVQQSDSGAGGECKQS